MKSVFSVVFTLGLALSSISNAADYTVDAGHSNVGFTIRHFVSKVNGDFRDYTGAVKFDEKSPEKSSITAVIKAATINTANDKRDAHLKGEDFFATEKYPEIKFVSKSFKKDGKTKNKYKVDGVLTMRGVEKPVVLDVEYLGSVKDMQGQMRTGFAASGKLNRKDFNINWNKALDAGGFVLGDDVMINLNIEAIEKK